MTCIVGIVSKDKVHIGGDSAGVSAYNIRARKDKKVFTNGEYVMGFSHSFRAGQVLAYDFEPPKIEGEDEEDLMRFMVKRFVPAVRKVLKDAGVSMIESNVESMGAVFMVGVRGRLFTVEGDFQVGETVDSYAAMGCGEEYALGSLHTTENSDMKPEPRVKAALAAAAHFSTGVCEPFNIVHT